ncbi:PREDICTED: venom serine protease-like [Atta colombica]|uniref:venom serine protease-like n=1 Tax=Atta colombica TaxID=520822 RepID=UPI00084C81F9|nr:PREDICTED: venom serine protease-like [Atta colombica]
MMEFCWKFYENIKEVKVLLGLMLSLLVLNGVEPNCYKILDLKEGQTLYLQNDNYPNYGGENICTWKIHSSVIIKATCYIDLNDDCNENIFLFDDGNSTSYTTCGQDTITFEGFNSTITIIFASAFNQGRFICEIKSNTCQCGKKKVTRIVGGEETEINEFPWMTGIVDLNTNILFCGATIIYDRYILTAAHCLYEKNINEIVAVVGEHDVSTGSDTNATKIYELSECVIHPEYDFTKDAYNDIAICETVERIKYSPEVGPVCLPFKHKYDSFTNDIVTALGWGLNEYGGSKSDTLQKVDLKVIKCLINNTNIICTFTPEKDTCQMDSGGPILWNDPITNRIILVGIISAGEGCASNKPSLNMRVSAFIDWIVSITPDAQYCQVE